MASATIRVGSGTLRAVGNALLPLEAKTDGRIKLSIRIADHDVSIRDLAAFLDLTDRLYGRQWEDGFRSYALHDKDHIQITTLKRGSWQLDLIQLLGSTPSFSLIFLAIVLGNLKGLAEAYNSVQQGRLANVQRKSLIKERLRADERLTNVDDDALTELSDSITQVLEKDHKLLTRAVRFSEKDLLGVDVSTDDSDDSDDSD